MNETSNTFDAVVDNFLMHYGTKGMHRGVHGEGKRWQSHAVYAQGRPNPDAKVRGLNDERRPQNNQNNHGNQSNSNTSPEPKSEWYKDGYGKRPLGRSGGRMKETTELERTLRDKSISDLENATRRLKAENNLKQELINMNRLNKQYNEAIHEDDVKIMKTLGDKVRWLSKTVPAKIAFNAAKYQAYEWAVDKYGAPKANALFSGVLNTGGKNKGNKNK